VTAVRNQLALEGHAHSQSVVSILEVVAIQHRGNGGGDALAQLLLISQAQLHHVVDLGTDEGFFFQVINHAQVDDHISASVLISALSVFGSSTTAAGAFGDLDPGIDLLVRLVKE